MLKLKPPRKGKTPFWYVRGSHLGIAVNRSTKARDRDTAKLVRRAIKAEIECGAFATKGAPTFVTAAAEYMAATGQDRFIDPLTDHFGHKTLPEITQQAIDQAALALYPEGTAATRNRQVHTIVSAVLKHAGIEKKIKRPKGWRGSKRITWLRPEQAFALIRSARAIDEEFGIFLLVLTYTGMRLSDGLGAEVERLELAEAFLYLPDTKNGEPRGVHLPPAAVAALAAHPRGLDRKGERLFRFRKCGHLYEMLDEALATAGIVLPPRTGFHVLCHTWATWMRRYGGSDTRGLVGTGRWADEASASRYEHVVATEEARRADLLPVDRAWKIRGKRSARKLSA
jgi:integrase